MFLLDSIDAPKFRQLWLIFEWENKVAITVKGKSIKEYLKEFVEISQMMLIEDTDDLLKSNPPFLSLNFASRNYLQEVSFFL